MTIMILESVPPGLRGELSRWLIEPRAGVFIGVINVVVRDMLWDMCITACQDGGVMQIWSTNSEQRFDMRMFGSTRRSIVDYEGLMLVRRQ